MNLVFVHDEFNYAKFRLSTRRSFADWQHKMEFSVIFSKQQKTLDVRSTESLYNRLDKRRRECRYLKQENRQVLFVEAEHRKDFMYIFIVFFLEAKSFFFSFVRGIEQHIVRIIKQPH
jgi:hypothetical protein